MPRKFSSTEKKTIDRLVLEFAVTDQKARELVQSFGEECVRRQIEAFSFRLDSVKSMAGFLICVVENDLSLPEGYFESLRRDECTVAEKKRSTMTAGGKFCEESGYLNLKSVQDPFYGMLHECTHDVATEEQFEEYTI